jgi:superfamily II DNA or RNA helicase
MKAVFAGWNEVARHLIEMADETSLTGASLNKGQRASLKALASRITKNGVVIADEVGMGKTRIAAFVAKAVSLSGGRCAVVIPPGLGFQWQDEFKTCCSATIWMGTQRQSGWPFRRSRREDDCRSATITQAIFS